LLSGGPILNFLPTLTDGSTTLGKFLPEILRSCQPGAQPCRCPLWLPPCAPLCWCC
jgi:hypothetical protein